MRYSYAGRLVGLDFQSAQGHCLPKARAVEANSGPKLGDVWEDGRKLLARNWCFIGQHIDFALLTQELDACLLTLTRKCRQGPLPGILLPDPFRSPGWKRQPDVGHCNWSRPPCQVRTVGR